MTSPEAMPIRWNWGHIFSLPNETRQHMVLALQHPEIYAKRVKGVVEMSKMPIQCASCNTAITFIDDDTLLGSKPYNHPLFMVVSSKNRRPTASSSTDS